MRNAEDGHAVASSHFTDGLKHAPNVCVLVTINGAHVGAERIDIDKTDVLAGLDMAF